MRVETRDLFELAGSRNDYVPQMIKDKKYFLPQDPAQLALAKKLINIFIFDSKIQGLENLDSAFASDEVVTIASRHRTDADHGGHWQWMNQAGRSDIAKRILFPAGLLMYERDHIRILMGAFNSVYIPTPTDERNIQAALASGSYNGKVFTGKDRDTLEFYKGNMESLKFASFRIMRGMVKRDKAVVLMYPEATRSRDGYLGRPPHEVSSYFEDGLVLPVFTDGLDKLFAPGHYNIARILGCLAVARLERSKPGVKRFTGKYPLFRITQDVIIGGAFRAEDAQKVDTSIIHNGIAASPADYVVGKLYELTPHKAKPEDIPFFKAVLASIS